MEFKEFVEKFNAKKVARVSNIIPEKIKIGKQSKS